MTNPYLEDEDVAYERLRQERDDDAARLRDTLENITRSLKRLVELPCFRSWENDI